MMSQRQVLDEISAVQDSISLLVSESMERSRSLSLQLQTIHAQANSDHQRFVSSVKVLRRKLGQLHYQLQASTIPTEPPTPTPTSPDVGQPQPLL